MALLIHVLGFTGKLNIIIPQLIMIVELHCKKNAPSSLAGQTVINISLVGINMRIEDKISLCY